MLITNNTENLSSLVLKPTKVISLYDLNAVNFNIVLEKIKYYLHDLKDQSFKVQWVCGLTQPEMVSAYVNLLKVLADCTGSINLPISDTAVFDKVFLNSKNRNQVKSTFDRITFQGADADKYTAYITNDKIKTTNDSALSRKDSTLNIINHLANQPKLPQSPILQPTISSQSSEMGSLVQRLEALLNEKQRSINELKNALEQSENKNRVLLKRVKELEASDFQPPRKVIKIDKNEKTYDVINLQRCNKVEESRYGDWDRPNPFLPKQ